MKISIDKTPKKYFHITRETIKKFCQKNSLNPKLSVSIFFISDQKMRSLNKKYRQINKTTDILSFPIWEKLHDIPKKGEVNLGDIFISSKEFIKNAAIKKISPEAELEFLIIHGLNHLIGKHH